MRVCHWQLQHLVPEASTHDNSLVPKLLVVPYCTAGVKPQRKRVVFDIVDAVADRGHGRLSHP